VTVLPSAAVLDAFGASGPVPLPGGRGRCVRAGAVVLKPVDDPVEAAWTAQLLASLDGPGFRVPRPVRTADGGWVADGWTAWEFVEGEADRTRWGDTLAVCEAFHRAVADVTRPGFLDTRVHPWAVADRFAWAGAGGAGPADPLLDRLVGVRRPLDLPAQVVHGDLAANVLFAPVGPPVVIDLAPYWRPAGYARAVVVVDALVWGGAGPDLLHAVEHVAGMDQLLVRAALFRLAADVGRAGRSPGALAHHTERYRPTVELVCALAGG
jgi:uncharacterized protein (TIGR02569 family)